jgi:probable HAF family extracellular repeat protein
MTDLGTLPGGSVSQAHAINNHGEIVGGVDTVDFAFHAFLYRNAPMSDLAVRVGDSSSFSSAFGISDSRQVAVDTLVSTVNGPQQHAVLYIGSTIRDLGVLKGDNFSFVRGINNSGQIVVGSSNGDTTRAFLYRNGKMKDLGTLGGGLTRADGINNRGQIVGFSLTHGHGAVHGFLFSEDKMQDLNKLVPAHSGWTLGEAFAINDNGQIAGSGTAPNGENRAFLLTPKHR